MPIETEATPTREASAEASSELRAQSHAQIERETAERVKNNPKPTEEEINAGAFPEMIEPQVRDAVFEMRKRGYSTESSGFGGKAGEVQQIDGNFEIDKQTAEMLQRNGIQVLTREADETLPWTTSVRFPTDSVPGSITMEKLKDKWVGIAHLLPDLGKPAEPSISGGTEDFIKQHAPERTDILERIKGLREKYEREQDEATRRKEAETGTDRKYAGEVSRYFGAAREIARIGVELGDEEYSYEDFLAEQQRTLERLANPRKAERMTPEEVSLTLSDLSGNMALNNPDIESNRSGDPKQDAENEKRYLESKRLFMESAAKIFPEAKPDFAELDSTLGRLRESSPLVPEVSGAEVEQLLRDNPRELAGILDDALYLASGKVKGDAWVAYQSEDRTAQEAKLATAPEALYKLQLMRDKLQEQMYGRAEVSPSDAGKIDEIRSGFSDLLKEQQQQRADRMEKALGVRAHFREQVAAITPENAGTLKGVVDFLKARSEIGVASKEMYRVGEQLASGKPTREQLTEALDLVERQFHISKWMPALEGMTPKLDTMRKFLKGELQKASEKAAPEAKEAEPELKALKEKAARAKSYLENNGVKIRIDQLRLEDDIDRWRKVTDGLDKIRSAFLKDSDPAFKKVPKYQPEVDKLFASLKR